ncbi:MAG: hypothetical protein QM500_09400 [Methylococcales bacterium]
MKTKIISISLTPELAEWFKEYAEFCEVGRSYLVREMIKHLKRSVEYSDDK